MGERMSAELFRECLEYDELGCLFVDEHHHIRAAELWSALVAERKEVERLQDKIAEFIGGENEGPHPDTTRLTRLVEQLDAELKRGSTGFQRKRIKQIMQEARGE